jgi:hypothetical protein
MRTELSNLEIRVRNAIRTSAVGEHLRNVVVEADRDDEGTDFLRIVLEMTGLEEVSDDDMESVMRSIESTLSEVDERFPSVRFSDAA